MAVTGAAALVEGHGQEARRAPLDQITQKARETIERVCGITGFVVQRRRLRVPGAEDVHGGIDQIDHAASRGGRDTTRTPFKSTQPALDASVQRAAARAMPLQAFHLYGYHA